MGEKTIILIPDETPDKYLEMPEGLNGYWWEADKTIWVPFVEAYKAGAFSQFLKMLTSKNKIVFFPTVISARLKAILISKGYVLAGVNNQRTPFLYGLALIPQTKSGQSR